MAIRTCKKGRHSRRASRQTPRGSVGPSTPPAVTYERDPGSGATPLRGVYRRHEPEKTVLHGIVREHLETFLAQARGPDGDGYPRFVEHEFRRYLDCGLLCHGFARLRCPQCGYERLVAFSCKGKLCPTVPLQSSTGSWWRNPRPKLVHPTAPTGPRPRPGSLALTPPGRPWRNARSLD